MAKKRINLFRLKNLLTEVQTMDEINVAGFIDLLRYQFKNRQIFISTHEDHTSSYFRYKFSKAGLEQERINLKELSKIETENDTQ